MYADGREVPVFLCNLSDNSARIRVMTGANLPDRFQLKVQLAGVNRACVVVWHRGSDCGIRFD